jgi:hypothetical protein
MNTPIYYAANGFTGDYVIDSLNGDAIIYKENRLGSFNG